MDLLRSDGYEPRRDGDDILLGNCPFHALAREETELVCGMNLNYLDGLTDGIGATALHAELDPAELTRVLVPRPLPPAVADTFSARVAGDAGITVLDALECWIYQHGLRHMG